MGAQKKIAKLESEVDEAKRQGKDKEVEKLMKEINKLIQIEGEVHGKWRECRGEVDRLEKYKNTIMRLKSRIKEQKAEIYFWEKKIESLTERISELDKQRDEA